MGGEAVGREGISHRANGGVQRALPLAGRHLGGERGAVLLADRLRHALGLLGGQERERPSEQQDEQVVAPSRELEGHVLGRSPVALGGTARPTGARSLDVHLQVPPGGQLVEVMTGHVGMEVEMRGHLPGRHALALSGEQVDVATGRVAERRGDGGHGGGELLVAEGPALVVVDGRGRRPCSALLHDRYCTYGCRENSVGCRDTAPQPPGRRPMSAGDSEVREALASVADPQLRRGITHMLPTEDAAWVGDELTRRFGVGSWQFALSASDANRWVLRLARHITRRSKVVVHDHCYHGSVDEAIAMLGPDGSVVPVRGSVGPQVDVAETTRVVDFNDVGALEAALADATVAAVLIEPALTNVGIVLPEPGYLDAVREATRRTGALLVIDETHTICAGPGGATALWNLEPDILVIGKTIGGGIPSAAYGFSPEVAGLLRGSIAVEDSDVGGIGGTLAGYALSLAAIRATLEDVLTAEAFDRMIPLAERWQTGVERVLGDRRVPWHVTRLGARAEYHFMPEPPRTGAEQWAHADPELERFLHLWAMNRGVLMTPFHNMALMSPPTTEADVDRHTDVFDEAVEALFGA